MFIYFYKIRDKIREKKRNEKSETLQETFILSLNNIKKPMERILDKYTTEKEWYHDNGDLRFFIPKDELSLEEIIDNVPSALLLNRKTHVFDYSNSISIHTNEKIYEEHYSTKNRVLFLSLIGAIEELFVKMGEEDKNLMVSSFSESLRKIESLTQNENYSTFINSDKQRKICSILREIKDTCELLDEKQKDNIDEDLDLELKYTKLQKDKIKMLTGEKF